MEHSETKQRYQPGIVLLLLRNSRYDVTPELQRYVPKYDRHTDHANVMVLWLYSGEELQRFIGIEPWLVVCDAGQGRYRGVMLFHVSCLAISFFSRSILLCMV